MATLRIALANLRFPSTPDESVALAVQAIAQAGGERTDIICFPECYVPGYRAKGKRIPPPDSAFLNRAWNKIANSAAKSNVAVILGTERISNGSLLATALVINHDGSTAGFQDKVQIDPSEEDTYAHGEGRHLFELVALKFGVVICHEGWRYPETVRWAARRGAQVVFHPHFHEAEPGSYVPSSFADPANSFHEKSMLCRAAENTCWFASVNCASPGSSTTSAIICPDGTPLIWQPYGKEGLLVADIDPTAATCLLANRFDDSPHGEPDIAAARWGEHVSRLQGIRIARKHGGLSSRNYSGGGFRGNRCPTHIDNPTETLQHSA